MSRLPSETAKGIRQLARRHAPRTEGGQSAMADPPAVLGPAQPIVVAREEDEVSRPGCSQLGGGAGPVVGRDAAVGGGLVAVHTHLDVAQQMHCGLENVVRSGEVGPDLLVATDRFAPPAIFDGIGRVHLVHQPIEIVFVQATAVRMQRATNEVLVLLDRCFAHGANLTPYGPITKHWLVSWFEARSLRVDRVETIDESNIDW